MGAFQEYKGRYKAALGNLGREFSRWGGLARQQWRETGTGKKIAGGAALATGVGLAGWAFGPVGVAVYIGLETFTLTSFALNQAISRGVQDTKQKQAMFMFPNFLTGFQHLLAGGFGRAVMGLNGLVQNIITSFVPDRILDAQNPDGSSKNRRFKLGMAFSGLTIGSSATLASFLSLWEIIPAIAGTMVATSSVMTSSLSQSGNRDPQVRALQGGSQGLMSLYSALHAGLFLKMSTDLMDFQAHMSSLLKFHIPILDQSGKKIPLTSRFNLAARKVVTLEQQPGFTPIQLAHPNKVAEEQRKERVLAGVESPETQNAPADMRDALFQTLATSGNLTDDDIRISHGTFIKSLKLIDDTTLRDVWGVARDKVQEIAPLDVIFARRADVQQGREYTPVFGRGAQARAILS